MKRLKIDNPRPGEPDRIRPGQARRAVAAGLARYSDRDENGMATSIVLLDSAHDAAERHIADAWLWRRREAHVADSQSAMGYDRINRTMGRRELDAVPVVMAEKLLLGKPLIPVGQGLIKFGLEKRGCATTTKT